jgi:hypothetical protein
MKRLFAVLFCLQALLSTPGPALAAGEGPALVRAARQAYAAGDFVGASRDFVRAFEADPGLATTGFCLDAATAGRLAGDPGRAAFWLYQAALAAPHDGETARALAAAGLEAGALFTGSWTVAGLVPVARLWLVVLWANACFWLLLTGARLLGRRLSPSVATAAGLVLALLWLTVGWGTFAGAQAPRGVVLGREPAISAPEDGAEAVPGFAVGELVAVGERRGGRVLVRGGDGRAGWLPRDAIAILRP